MLLSHKNFARSLRSFFHFFWLSYSLSFLPAFFAWFPSPPRSNPKFLLLLLLPLQSAQRCPTIFAVLILSANHLLCTHVPLTCVNKFSYTFFLSLPLLSPFFSCSPECALVSPLTSPCFLLRSHIARHVAIHSTLSPSFFFFVFAALVVVPLLSV